MKRLGETRSRSGPAPVSRRPSHQRAPCGTHPPNIKEESTVFCTLSSLLGAATAAVAAAAAAEADCCRAAAATACCSPPPAAPALPLQHGLEALSLLDPPLHNNRVSQHDHQGGLVSTLERSGESWVFPTACGAPAACSSRGSLVLLLPEHHGGVTGEPAGAGSDCKRCWGVRAWRGCALWQRLLTPSGTAMMCKSGDLRVRQATTAELSTARSAWLGGVQCRIWTAWGQPCASTPVAHSPPVA